jgi:Zn-dependent peptidase ImmA (M78 family)
VKLRRGFKKEAKEIALDVRRELGIEAFAPLDPYALATLYGIEVFDLSAPDLPAAAVQHFTVLRTEAFSAALVPIGTGSIVIENHVHDPLRRRSTMAHEMAHVLLEHEFGLLLASDDGCRSSSSAIEEEAAELSGELLIPCDAARIAALKGWLDPQVAEYFNVSEAMARWRMNATGARKIAGRVRARWR